MSSDTRGVKLTLDKGVLRVSSDNPELGVDSRHRGPVPDADVIAVTVARIWPRPRRL